jgi:hypothetical protein
MERPNVLIAVPKFIDFLAERKAELEAQRTKNNNHIKQGQSPTSDIQYIDLGRLDELRAITSQNFDLTKLVQLCEEINMNYKHGNYLSVAMLARTITNHIPPIFNFSTFDEVKSNYGGPQVHKSFKKNMKNLADSLKHIGDRLLHERIRAKEALPKRPQVDFRADFDVLFEEVVRILKNDDN